MWVFPFSKLVVKIISLFFSILAWLNFTNQINNHLFSGKCGEWRASVAGDKCFRGPLLPGRGKLPSQILSELFSDFLLSFWGNKADFTYSAQTLGGFNCLLVLLMLAFQKDAKGAKRCWLKTLLLGEKAPNIFEWGYLHCENSCNE